MIRLFLASVFYLICGSAWMSLAGYCINESVMWGAGFPALMCVVLCVKKLLEIKDSVDAIADENIVRTVENARQRAGQ